MATEDEVDAILDKQDGLINREKDQKLCRHGGQSKCAHCLPIDPFDETYLTQKDIKHMSFHAYLRKFRPHGKSTSTRYPLENVSCKIKPGCTTHPPWPDGICTKCQPNAVTLNRQRFRHVDNISFENEDLVSQFLDYYRKSAHQRIGFLLGYYEQQPDVPLGIRAVVTAIYEPPQTSTSDSVQLLPDAKSGDVDDLCRKLGIRQVGWIFTDLVADDKNVSKVKCTRHVGTYTLSAEECITAGYFQSLHPNVCKYCSDGIFGSKFVTVIVTGDANQHIQLFGYQVSNQCAALVAENCLVPTKDSPELAYVRESTSKQYIPDVYFKEKDQYGNEVTKIGRPLPVEYLLVDVPASAAKEPRFFFYSSPTKKPFPVENRMALSQLQKTIDDLLNAIKKKDKSAAVAWKHGSSEWSILCHLMKEHGSAIGGASAIPERVEGEKLEHLAIYHERQSLELCALHSLNNLFQGVAFTKESLDDICKRLSPDTGLWNPHKSFIGLGNYDVNVLMTALSTKDCSAVWFDKRKNPEDIRLDKIVGFILNIPSEPKIGPIKIPFIKRRHWIAVREVNGAYYNLDSKLDQPDLVGTNEDVVKYLKSALKCKDKEVFVIVSRLCDQDRSWFGKV